MIFVLLMWILMQCSPKYIGQYRTSTVADIFSKQATVLVQSCLKQASTRYSKTLFRRILQSRGKKSEKWPNKHMSNRPDRETTLRYVSSITSGIDVNVESKKTQFSLF